MATPQGSQRPGFSPGPGHSLAAAIDLLAADAPLSETLASIVEAIESASAGLSAVISLVPDGEQAELWHPGTAARCHCEPVRSGRGAVLGTLIISPRPPRPLAAAELALVASAAKIAAVAIEHMRLHDAEAGYRAIVERMPAIVYIADAGVAGRWYYISPQIESVLGFTREQFLSDPELWLRQLHPEDREAVISEELDAESDGGRGYASASEYRMFHREGQVVWIRDDALLVKDDLGRTRWHGVLSDITDRKRVEAEAEQRAAKQAAVARLGEHALEGADLTELMNEAVHEAARIMDAQIASVFEFMPSKDTLVLRAGVGWGVVGESRIPAGKRSQSGYTIETGRPVIVTDWEHERRFEKPQVLIPSDTRSGLCVVIEGHDRPFGVLGLQCGAPREYSSSDVDFIQSVANVLADAIQRQSTEDDIRHRALHDSLTRLPNRVLFIDRLSHALARMRRQRSPVAVLFLDIDHFKLVNDSLGHQAGDDLLVAVSSSLQAAVRPGDTVARFGGDEFGILLEEISSERDAAEVAQRIAAAFARPFVLGSTEHFVSASVGIALAESGDQQPEMLIRDADAAMYRAKERGRARYELFDADMRARAVARLRIENDLRRALEREELRLEYQPVVSLRDGSITVVEALVRWSHPERGIVGPNEFIPVAEECGLIEPIGRWVLAEACRQAAQWHEGNPDSAPVGISVNLSPRQMVQADLPQVVAHALAASGIDPSTVSLEITETVLLEEAEVVRDTLRALKAMGVRLVLDDFGTGYSSLGYLKRLPLDTLKIDRSFVDGLGTERGDSAIVEAVIGMARALSLGVIAEGVENELQLTELNVLGCDQAQGYYFSRPISASEVTPLLGHPSPFRDALETAAGPAQRPAKW